MRDVSLAQGPQSQGAAGAADELVAANHHHLWAEKGVLLAGQNLRRGALLGRITASGKLTQSTAGASDGSQNAVGVLVHDRDASAGDAEVDYYTRGDFNQDRVGFGTGQTPDSVRAVLADLGIRLHKRFGAPLGNVAQPAI